jgi:hypothetical protein
MDVSPEPELIVSLCALTLFLGFSIWAALSSNSRSAFAIMYSGLMRFANTTT